MANESVYHVGVSTPKIIWLRLLLLFLLSSLCLILVEGGSVKSDRFGFKHLPVRPFVYFKESDNILYHDLSGNVWISTDTGKNWDTVSGVPENVAVALHEHPFDPDRAYILTNDKEHYKTTDKGRTWQRFTVSTTPTKKSNVLSFHALMKNFLLFKGTECKSWFECTDVTYYTKDNFDSHELLLENTERCIWAYSSIKFDEAPTHSIFCIQYDASGSGSTRKLSDYRLVESEDYFSNAKTIDFNSGGDVSGVIGLGETQEFLVAAVKNPNSLDLKMYVSRNGYTWARAFFPLNKGPKPLPRKEEAYTILESPSDHLIVDLLSDESVTGSLYISNSNGTYFVNRLNNTRRNKDGFVDFRHSQGAQGFGGKELPQNIGGILLANIVYNYQEITMIDDPRAQVQSKISFDDGITWKFIKPPERNFDGRDFPCKGRNEEECSLHLYSVIDARNRGQIFSANAPGVLMGVGRVGKYLLPYEQCDTFLSYDGGLTWKVVRLGAHMYAVGQYGSIMVMIDDEQPTDVFLYSVDRGETWVEKPLDNERTKIRAQYLTTDPESTSKSFILLGSTVPDGSTGNRHFTFKLDFSELFDKNCNGNNGNDFDNWVLQRSESESESDCFMGERTTYHRRKSNAQCFVSKAPEPNSVRCACTEKDYECDYNYILDKDGKNCLPLVPETIPKGECTDGKKTYLGSSGFRLIPDNKCDFENGNSVRHEPVERKCDSVPLYGEVSHRTAYFAIDPSYFYFSESSVLMVKTNDGNVKRSENGGTTWEDVLPKAGPIAEMFLHDHNGERAYFFPVDADESGEYYMWYTKDRGATFENITLEKEPNKLNIRFLDFHPKHHDWLLYMASTPCPRCHSIAYFSSDNGKHWNVIDTWAEKCLFGVDTDFSGSEDDVVFCSSYKDKNNTKITQDELGGRTSEENPLQLHKIKTDGKTKKFLLDDSVNFFIFNEFMAAAKEERGQLLLYTSINGSTFTKVAFPPNLIVDKQAYTILPSHTGSIFLDVYKPTRFGYGSLFKSNSEGTAFNRILDNTNRNIYGNVDFEKVNGLDGIIIANQVENVNELNDYVKKKIISKISYDDGSHWKRLKMNNGGECQDDNCYLNLHGRTDIYGSDSIFSAPSAIGLLIGVGNVGPHLLPYDQCYTYMSRDAGRTWTEIRHGASLYEFGDQGTIIVVVDNKGPTDNLKYTWNYGKDWNTYKFSSNPVRAIHLTTDKNSTSMIFLLYGYSIRESKPVVITIDFSKLEKRKCEKDDFELWNPMDESSEDHWCLLGQDVRYQRRKADSECNIGEFEMLPIIDSKPCRCNKHDFECDDGFWSNEQGKCELLGPDPERPANCQGKYSARSGYVKMKKSKCEGGPDLSERTKKNCESGNIIISKTTMLSQRIADYYYFNKTNTILALTMDSFVWRGTDEGHTWEIPEKLKDVKVYAIIQNPYFNDRAYCIAQDKKIFYTSDSGKNFEEIKVPMDPNNLQLPILDFHPVKQEYLIYTGSEFCESIYSTKCHAEAFYTINNGKDWKSIETYVRKCQWAKNDNLIICESYRDKKGSQLSFYDNPLQLVYVKSFKKDKVPYENIVGAAFVEEYMVVAELMPSGQSLRLWVSLDTETFAEAKFPQSIPAVQEAYTALQSTNNAVMLHVTTSINTRSKYGSILKSNGNGTYYSLSLENANRDDAGYVDFEKMQGIQGIALANIVSNVYEVNMGSDKKLKSMITFNDGAKWSLLNKPDNDSNGHKYKCNGETIENCSLHLHSFTERRNLRDSFSSYSAIGLMIGVGNVGSYLTQYEQGDTFLTRDAGVTWKEIIKGAYMYEFGNQGGIIVLVDDEKPTGYVLYSLNEGQVWQKYNFIKVGEQPIKVHDIDTMPGGLSSKFILRGVNPSRVDEEVIVYLDFSNIHTKKCIFDNSENSDFEKWSPNATTEDGCLFGHKITYFRKRLDRECFIDENLKDKRTKGDDCFCTDDDFECAYNFVRNAKTGDCELYPGAQPLHDSMEEQCVNGEKIWTELTGYRKILPSTCKVDKYSKYKVHECPSSHSSLFWIIIVLSLLIVVAILVICFINRRHGRSGYGRIRLGGSIEPDSILYSIADIFYQIRMPRFVSRLWSSIPLPGRGSRYHYSPVATDDGHEVLMDDYEQDNEAL